MNKFQLLSKYSYWKVKDKKMKRIISKLILIVVILVSLLGIGYAVIVRPRLPEWTVEQMMVQLSELDLELLGLEEDLTDSQAELFEIILEIVMENLSYEITGSRIERRMAYVTMNMEVVDTARLILDNYDIILNNVLSNIGSLIFSVFGEGLEEVVIGELINLLTDDALTIVMTTREIEIPLERTGFFWTPILTDEILLSMVGLDELTFGILDQIIN